MTVLMLALGFGHVSIAVSAEGEQWRLPFSAGTTLTLDQAYLGTFSHNGQYALDIQGDNIEIAATKSGFISAIRVGGKWNQWCNSNSDCLNKGGIWRGNHIEITHDDGTVSFYLHLRGDSVPYNLGVGSYVRQGQVIGRTGSTGYTCSLLYPNCSVPDPHVHFEVQRNRSSIPTVFEDCDYHGNQCINGAPVPYRYYTSINTNPFEIKELPIAAPMRLQESGLGMRLSSVNRGAAVIGSLADQAARFYYLNGEIIGPQFWCLDTSSGIEPASEGETLAVKDCDKSDSQKWTQNDQGVIYSQESDLCIAPAQQKDESSLGQALILKSCPNGTEYKWGQSNGFKDVPQNCFIRFSKPGVCSNLANHPKPATMHLFDEGDAEEFDSNSVHAHEHSQWEMFLAENEPKEQIGDIVDIDQLNTIKESLGKNSQSNQVEADTKNNFEVEANDFDDIKQIPQSQIAYSRDYHAQLITNLSIVQKKFEQGGGSKPL